MAILLYTIYKNDEIKDIEKEDSSARYLMNTILSSYSLNDLDFKAQQNHDIIKKENEIN